MFFLAKCTQLLSKITKNQRLFDEPAPSEDLFDPETQRKIAENIR
jgi:hypothetical protein